MFSVTREYVEIGAVPEGPRPIGRTVRDAGHVRRSVRQRGRAPWPARPVVVPAVPLRLVTEPVRACALPRGERLPAGSAVVAGVRRVLAGAAVFAVAAAVVVGLGVLAGSASQARGQSPAVVSITVGEPATVWDVARRFAPAAEGVELSAVVERIVTINSLTSVHVRPGQVLRIPLR